MFLSDISIKRPIMISMVLLVFVLFGALSYFGMRLELTPPVEVPVITVQTIYGGAGPEEIETQVSKKVEDATASISGVDYMLSYSMENVSIVMIAFNMQKDVYLALQEVKDKVDGMINDLPDAADSPIIQRVDPTNLPVVDLVLSGPIPITQLYDLADNRVAPRLAQVAGVADVKLTGGQEREIHVNLDNRMVLQQKLSLSQIASILATQNMDMPGGNFKQRGQEYSVRLEGEFDDVETIRNMDVPTQFGMKKLGDIANVSDSGEEVRERTIYFNNVEKVGDDNVVKLSLMKTSDGNPVKIYKELSHSMKEFEKMLPEGCHLNIVNENANFIKSAVADTMTNIFLGVVLTSLVLLFFLHDYKSTLIVALSMPISIVSTFLFMQLAGFSLNILSLMGLSTAVGILVANSVVVLENIFRHKSLGHDKVTSASKGTSEIAVAVIASTLTNLVVFLPLGTMSSLAGQVFEQFSLTVVFATIFSLITAFTITPMMASKILPDHDRKKHPIGERMEGWFKSLENAYANLLNRFLLSKKRGALTIAISVLLLIGSLMLASTIGFEFMPEMDEGFIGVKVELPVGYDLESTASTLQSMEEKLKQYEEVSHFWTELGRIGDTDIGVNAAYLKIKLVDVDQRSHSSAEMSNRFIHDFSVIPNANINVASLLSFTSGRSDIQFYLRGTDADQLSAYHARLAHEMKIIPGLINLTTSLKSGKPEVQVVPRRDVLSETGLTVYHLATALRGSVDGVVSTAFKDAGNEYDIRVQVTDESVDTPQEIAAIPVVGASGTYRMDQLADIRISEGYSKILHYNRTKTIQFECDVATGYLMGDIMNEINRIVADMDMPTGYEITYGGMSKEMNNTIVDIARAFIIAIVLTYMLLAAILESLTQPLLILSTVPLALIGVFGGLVLTGLSMNIISMLAIVMLIGIVVNNAILLLDYTNQLVRNQGMSVHDALITACPTKLKPILMSNIAIILGMLPMALGVGTSGAELRQPMGVVSIGGLLASTLLSLIVIPVLYNVVSRKQAQK